MGRIYPADILAKELKMRREHATEALMSTPLQRLEMLTEVLDRLEARNFVWEARCPVGIYIIRGDRFEYVNARLAAFYGITPEDLLAIPVSTAIAMFVHPGDVSRVMSHIKDRQESREAMLQYRFMGIDSAGNTFTAESISLTVLIEDTPTIIGIVVQGTTGDK